MRLKANGRYAVTAMIDLAAADLEKKTSLRMIAERQAISLSYLEQIFTKLRHRKIVQSFKGPGGGYKLAKPKDQISVAEILEAVGSSINATRCNGKKNCMNGKQCQAHDLWSNLNFKVEEFLSKITLDSLINDNHDNFEQHLFGYKKPINNHIKTQ